MDAHGSNARAAQLPADEAVADGADRPDLAIEHQHFKQALGNFATGVTLATTWARGEPHGMTANAVMSVSLDPPLVLLSVQQGTRMHLALCHGDNFALSVLSEGQEAVARHFADPGRPHGPEAFAQFPHHPGLTGAPLLDGALAGIDCRIVDVRPAGDHLLFLGRVVYLEVAAGGSPLLYFRGRLGWPGRYPAGDSAG